MLESNEDLEFLSLAYASDVSASEEIFENSVKTSLKSDWVSHFQELFLGEAEPRSRHRNVSLHPKGYCLRFWALDGTTEPLVADVTGVFMQAVVRFQVAVLWAVRLF